MLTENNWMIYGEGHALAYKRVEADIQKINMLITGSEEGYSLAIEAGMDSVSVAWKRPAWMQTNLPKLIFWIRPDCSKRSQTGFDFNTEKLLGIARQAKS